jgi:hypothetical protein
MQRRTVAVLVLGGICVAGGVGGRLMSLTGRPRPRPAAARQNRSASPLAALDEACPGVSARPEVGCDTVVTSGD